jgi:hypothetical protein
LNKGIVMAHIFIAICVIGLPATPVCVSAADTPIGSLKVEKKSRPGTSATEIIAYTPREGDFVFYDDRNIFWTILFAYVGATPPLHMGIAVKQSDGSLAILEAGPDDTVWVSLLDLQKRLRQFDEDYHGTITIRRCKKELTKDQSAALTKFAEAQDGKRYAVGRLLLEGTFLRVRGPLRELFLGGTYFDRDSWMCAELAVVAAGKVGLLDPRSIAANATYPCDVVDNRRHDLSASWHDPAVWTPKK